MLHRLESSDRDGKALFRVTDLAGPNTFSLALLRRSNCSPTVNVERLELHYTRTDCRSSLGSVTDPGKEDEYEAKKPLNRKTIHGFPPNALCRDREFE